MGRGAVNMTALVNMAAWPKDRGQLRRVGNTAGVATRQVWITMVRWTKDNYGMVDITMVGWTKLLRTP
jgi:hypothetical protein